MNKAEQIREIWEEMKLLKRLHEQPVIDNVLSREMAERLLEKYEEIDILFGHESTLLKAIIFYINNF